ncbi:hypothetical protein HNR46_003522 [Haloferula luteola]|uniref:Uncharacterized protein n=1 Tax=Haloferula luteola TaxID=595692 RepID=A0A840V4R5_9BACT|nr:hypothetical protein [Haloferula luteola]MBB5353267.1 hypothetical protein [Haloferula luteola]
MRGSPIFRTLFLVLGLVLAAAGVHTLTRPRTPVAPSFSPAATTSPAKAQSIPFELTLSAAAREVVIESNGETQTFTPAGPLLSGHLLATGEHPTIFLTILWVEADATPRFAKLRLEPPGSATRSHTFDAVGDLEDVWEPHLH